MRPARPDAGDLCERLARLARRYELGAVGLAGKHAAGIAERADPLEVFVAVDFDRARGFGEDLAEITSALVCVYDVRRLSWAHPLHLCVKWVNVTTLPRVDCPRGVCATVRHPNGAEGLVLLDTVPHFRLVDRPPDPVRGKFMEQFRPPPFGAFLL